MDRGEEGGQVAVARHREGGATHADDEREQHAQRRDRRADPHRRGQPGEPAGLDGGGERGGRGAEGGGGVTFGAFGFDIAFKYVSNDFTLPVDHSVRAIPISLRATLGF